MLCNGKRNSGDVDLLESIAAYKRRRDVAGYGNHRNAVHISRCNSGYEVCSAGTACREHNSGLSGKSCVSVGCVSRTLFVRSKIMFDFVAALIQCVVDVERSSSGIAENRVYSLFHENACNYFRACQHHNMYCTSVNFQKQPRGYKKTALVPKNK